MKILDFVDFFSCIAMPANWFTWFMVTLFWFVDKFPIGYQSINCNKISPRHLHVWIRRTIKLGSCLCLSWICFLTWITCVRMFNGLTWIKLQMSGQFLLNSMVFLLHFLLQRLLFAYECCAYVWVYSVFVVSQWNLRRMPQLEKFTKEKIARHFR